MEQRFVVWLWFIICYKLIFRGLRWFEFLTCYMLAALVQAAIYQLCFKQSDSISDFGLKQNLMGSRWSPQYSCHHHVPWCICNVLLADVAFKWSGNTAAMQTDQLADAKLIDLSISINIFIPTRSEWSSVSYQPGLPIVCLSRDAHIVFLLRPVTEGRARQKDDGAGNCGPDQQATGC